ncbi:acyl-CoA dehydrogenase family protein [Oceanicella sp. SM1341]|uniref:acyl-CoA dehydrogenase family protein n=1 Tax=Oceanicella sp. SM1341 TaxID=1548889 RepID=UPI0018E51988|nr:acyl-CoA dehydrogenase family protein [Oceanicella sp. SM1341]
MSLIPRTIFEPEHEQFRDSARRWVAEALAPRVGAWRANGEVDRESFLSAGAQGFLCLWADEAYGGAGVRDYRFDQVLQEEVVRGADPGFYLNLHSQIVAPYIDRFGTPALKDRLMPKAVCGETILAIAMTEPAAGSDLAGMQTRARPDGTDWLLSGSKTYISNGLLADAVVVAARTDPERPHAIGLFVVERGMAGFSRGRRLRKTGLDAQDTAELFFDDVRVPAENLLGEPAKGFAYMSELLATERLMVAIGSMAHAGAAFDETLAWVTGRRAFGRPIGAFQETRFAMARMRAELDIAQSFTDDCVMLANAGRLSAEVAAGVKLVTTGLENRVIDRCVQLHGGAGYMEEYRISRMYRDARVSRIFAGSDEIMKEIIARGLGFDARRLD